MAAEVPHGGRLARHPGRVHPVEVGARSPYGRDERAAPVPVDPPHLGPYGGGRQFPLLRRVRDLRVHDGRGPGRQRLQHGGDGRERRLVPGEEHPAGGGQGTGVEGGRTDHAEDIAGAGGRTPVRGGAAVAVQHEVDGHHVAFTVVGAHGEAAHPGPLRLRDREVRLVPAHAVGVVGGPLRQPGHGLPGARQTEFQLLVGPVLQEPGQLVGGEADPGRTGRDPLDVHDPYIGDRQRLTHRDPTLPRR